MDKYLTRTDGLINHIFWFYEDLDLQPKKNHYGISINYSDIKERKDDFLSELINTVVSWVYNNSKVKSLLESKLKESDDLGNAVNFITNLANNKFRKGQPQGQFGELLLFNLIQHYNKAVPILRKQRITTSTGHERFGADAIHYKKNGDTHLFILGESKCYESKYKFNAAFEISLNSIVDSFNKLDKELDLYLHEDFLEPDLEEIVKKYKEGNLENVKFELVCLIAYN
uniref:HamA C-terminal domain-containing protein n=1 Tax=Flavobacterium sp. TaxID=239 RepID=UPI002FDE0F3D